MRPDAGFVVVAQTLLKICDNVAQTPHEPKFRKLRLANAALRSRLLDRPLGVECAKLLGFQEGIEEGHLVLVPTAEKWENLVTGRRVLAQALTGAAPASPSAPFGASMGNGMNANWAAQAQNVLQNPQMAQLLQNDPMVRQMAQANPMLAQALQNPAMLAQQLQLLQQNPAMMQQVTQMMQDPSAMARMQQLMGGGPGLGGPGLGTAPFGAPAPLAANPFAPSAPSAPPTNPFAASFASPAPAPSATVTTPATTTFDEDEIAEAIARSLQDQS
jgi:hypothetical protein